MNNKIGENIRNLRKACGETQKDLAQVLNVSETAITNYEKGTRQPDMQTLKAIADHYDFPLERIMEEDLSWLDFTSHSIDWDSYITVFKAIFPIICSEKAMNNAHFSKAYAITEEIRQKIIVHENPMFSRVERAMEEYEAAFLEDADIVEAVANMIWLVFVIYSSYPDEQSQKMGEAVLYGKGRKKDFIKKYVLKNSNQTNNEALANKREYVKDSQETVMALIGILKQSSDYYALGDYYLALRYVTGMINNEYNGAFNKTIGMELMTSLATLENEYAIKMLKSALSM